MHALFSARVCKPLTTLHLDKCRLSKVQGRCDDGSVHCPYPRGITYQALQYCQRSDGLGLRLQHRRLQFKVQGSEEQQQALCLLKFRFRELKFSFLAEVTKFLLRLTYFTNCLLISDATNGRFKVEGENV